MSPLTEQQIRASFVNCSKGEAKRLNVPRDLRDQPWEDLEFLGWRDPQSRVRGYVVAEVDGSPYGIVLRATDGSAGVPRKNLCALCLTPHGSGGVVLMVAPRSGKAGQNGDSVGTYICADLQCSLYVRGKRVSDQGRLPESLTVEQQVERLTGNLAAFLRRVRG
ncbi:MULTISPECIES: FBP domain-containing protein [unclassified Nocardioides]|uniref:FBP domain-containing protein n=1 Tax=unclassified Nocardioides TaxID=2615069 RepID=UPI00114DB4E9|nr:MULTISPECIES: FBP domain-containing protein [unclassified Nocardioides]TQK69214.1 treble-clef zinc-finger protein [Nocardioides sp. SLBN-35]WGY01483.1 FBP domain-containing protein [Nocardioides sp. QY071]